SETLNPSAGELTFACSLTRHLWRDRLCQCDDRNRTGEFSEVTCHSTPAKSYNRRLHGCYRLLTLKI
ncbi:MAG TPA: hypothetical protein V6D48_06310, partial [Oculatellaceae cyanobacterium]